MRRRLNYPQRRLHIGPGGQVLPPLVVRIENGDRPPLRPRLKAELARGRNEQQQRVVERIQSGQKALTPLTIVAKLTGEGH